MTWFCTAFFDHFPETWTWCKLVRLKWGKTGYFLFFYPWREKLNSWSRVENINWTWNTMDDGEFLINFSNCSARLIWGSRRLPAPSSGYLHHPPATCTILQLPAPSSGYLHPAFGYLHQLQATWTILRLPGPSSGYLHPAFGYLPQLQATWTSSGYLHQPQATFPSLGLPSPA
jgi:hypothetical protein